MGCRAMHDQGVQAASCTVPCSDVRIDGEYACTRHCKAVLGDGTSLPFGCPFRTLIGRFPPFEPGWYLSCTLMAP